MQAIKNGSDADCCYFSHRTKASFENWLKSTRFSMELVVPRTVCVMMNVVIQAKKQVRDRNDFTGGAILDFVTF